MPRKTIARQAAFRFQVSKQHRLAWDSTKAVETFYDNWPNLI